jgi:3-hydroxybutyryl-CoA dehydratase
MSAGAAGAESRPSTRASTDPAGIAAMHLEEGSRFSTPGRTITEADLVGFSALTGDWHPQHSDAIWAEESSFGERIAHGMLVLAYGLGLVRFDPARVVALRSLRSVTFKRPIRIGDTIRTVGEVRGRRDLDPELALVTLRLTIEDATSARAAVRAELDILARRDG